MLNTIILKIVRCLHNMNRCYYWQFKYLCQPAPALGCPVVGTTIHRSLQPIVSPAGWQFFSCSLSSAWGHQIGRNIWILRLSVFFCSKYSGRQKDFYKNEAGLLVRLDLVFQELFYPDPGVFKKWYFHWPTSCSTLLIVHLP